MKPIYDQRKLSELIMFFADASECDQFFGSTKLNKLLFLADFWAYGFLGHSITGATYIHQKRGPTPRPNQFLSTRNDLVNGGRLQLIEEDAFYGKRKRPVATGHPDLSVFSDQEIDIAKEALEYLKHMSNMESRDWSHEFVGWKYTSDGEEIPYETIYLWCEVPVSKGDFEWARNVALDLGLEGASV